MICIDDDDVLYVTEWGNHRVSMFICEGNCKFILSFGIKGNGPGQFNQLCGIAVDKNELSMLVILEIIVCSFFRITLA